jgi:Tfp pilus assembly protein PilF
MEFIPLSARILVAVKSLIAYLWKMVVPLNLTPFYPYPRQVPLVSLEYIVSVVLVLGITATCIFIARKRQLWLSVWSYYVVTLLPVIGIVQVGSQAMADRYTYLPSLGPFLTIGLLASWVSVRVDGLKAVRIASIAVTIFIFTVVTVLTIEQIGIWKDSFSLWNFVIEKEADVPLAYNSRGVAYNRIGLVDKAFQDFNKTIALNPSYYEAYFNRGIVFEKMGQLDKAMQEYDKAIGLNPFYHEAYFNRGMVLQKTGQLDEAIRDFEKVITLNPAYYEAYSNLGALYGNAGILDNALECFNKAILINPNHPTGYLNRGIFYRSTGNREAALTDFRRACSLGDTSGCDALRDPPFTSEDKGK